MALPARAQQVLDRMVQEGLGQRPILFVCHSLGGLLVKHILRKADDAVDPRMRQVATSTRAILFLATPHCGAELASLLNAFRSVFGATVSIEDLRAHDAHLVDLYDWFRQAADRLGIETKTYYETRGVGGVLTIVNATTAQCGVGPSAVPLDEDHLSIAKPRDRGAQVCDALRDLLKMHVLAPRPTKPTEPATPRAALVEPPRVPCELPPPAEKHFGRQTELKQLTDRLRAGKNGAVVGPAGLGKTALAAEAVRAVVGNTQESMAASPFPDGVVLLDLYTYRGRAEPAWNNLANALAGPTFMDKSPARDRATEACRGRRVLVIIEGGEEADGQDGRSGIKELYSVLSAQNRRLLLTRVSDRAVPSETVELKEALYPDDAADLLDLLTHGRVTGDVRERVLELLEGHPLALTWAGNLLARDDDDPARLADDWESRGLPKLSDPTEAQHTLEWLFNRSVRGLDENSRQLLAAAGLLARAPFPLAAMVAVSGDETSARDALKALIRRGLLQKSGEADHWQFTHVLGYRFARKETGSDPALRENLARWLNKDLQKTLGSFDHQSASLSQLLEHGAALLRTDEDQRLWILLASSLLYETRSRLRDLGRLDLVKLALGAVADWLSFFPADGSKAAWLRERGVLLTRQGDVLRAQGDLAEALAAYRESLTLRQRFLETDPSNADWQRDLTVSHDRVGDVFRDQGDLPGALTAYREALAVTQRLVEAKPSNAEWQRNWGIGHTKVGDVLRDQGNLDGSLAAHRESLAVIRRLVEVDPSNTRWQRDVGMCHNRIGGVLRRQRDLPGALAAHRESLAVSRRLVEADPSNTGFQRDLSVSYNQLGDVFRDQGDLPGALTAYREALKARRRLVAADPSNAAWQRDLSVSHDRVGEVLRDQGDLPAALAAYRESLTLIRRLAEADLWNAGWQRDLSFSLTRVAQLLEGQHNTSEALPLAEESLAIDERLSALDPSNVMWQNDVAVSRTLVARLRGKSESPGD